MSEPAALLFLLLFGLASPSSEQPSRKNSEQGATSPEALRYKAEWRLIHAGNVRLSRTRPSGHGWQTDMTIQSVGLVSTLHKVDNRYRAISDDSLCAASSLLTAREGSRHRETSVTYDSERGKASSLERDLKKGTVSTREIDIPPCVHDVIGGLYRLRAMRVAVGSSVEIPISDGRKSILAKVLAQERETVRTPSGSYKTIRYEAFLFNGVFYRRKGRMFIWLTDDERRLPVQLRVRLPFYIGTVTLQLEKVET